jgi:hypothetical protein
MARRSSASVRADGLREVRAVCRWQLSGTLLKESAVPPNRVDILRASTTLPVLFVTSTESAGGLGFASKSHSVTARLGGLTVMSILRTLTDVLPDKGSAAARPKTRLLTFQTWVTDAVDGEDGLACVQIDPAQAPGPSRLTGGAAPR